MEIPNPEIPALVRKVKAVRDAIAKGDQTQGLRACHELESFLLALMQAECDRLGIEYSVAS